MTRPTRPRKQDTHRIVAAEVLHRHATQTRTPIKLPVPIELIVEMTYALNIEWHEIDEPIGHKILGALSPSTRTIVMNTKHLQMFERWVGPERFTLAHELAHWLYDAEHPEQQTLDLGGPKEIFCRRDDSSEVDATTRLREQNANALAAHILLPDALVLGHDAMLSDLRATAHGWGVSEQTLRIKLKGLGVLDDTELDQLGLFD